MKAKALRDEVNANMREAMLYVGADMAEEDKQARGDTPNTKWRYRNGTSKMRHIPSSIQIENGI